MYRAFERIFYRIFSEKFSFSRLRRGRNMREFRHILPALQRTPEPRRAPHHEFQPAIPLFFTASPPE